MIQQQRIAAAIAHLEAAQAILAGPVEFELNEHAWRGEVPPHHQALKDAEDRRVSRSLAALTRSDEDRLHAARAIRGIINAHAYHHPDARRRHSGCSCEPYASATPAQWASHIADLIAAHIHRNTERR